MFVAAFTVLVLAGLVIFALVRNADSLPKSFLKIETNENQYPTRPTKTDGAVILVSKSSVLVRHHYGRAHRGGRRRSALPALACSLSIA